jgi:hypothetical protein
MRRQRFLSAAPAARRAFAVVLLAAVAIPLCAQREDPGFGLAHQRGVQGCLTNSTMSGLHDSRWMLSGETAAAGSFFLLPGAAITFSLGQPVRAKPKMTALHLVPGVVVPTTNVQTCRAESNENSECLKGENRST